MAQFILMAKGAKTLAKASIKINNEILEEDGEDISKIAEKSVNLSESAIKKIKTIIKDDDENNE